VSEIEAQCRAFLHNAAARQSVVARVAPDQPSPDYQAGFGAGFEAGQVAALALAVSVLSGESPTALVEEACSRASVDAMFPFELHVEPVSDKRVS
jgi:hypothetical protein